MKLDDLKPVPTFTDLDRARFAPEVWPLQWPVVRKSRALDWPVVSNANAFVKRRGVYRDMPQQRVVLRRPLLVHQLCREVRRDT